MLKKMKKISIAKDFSPMPAGRFDEDGPYNGTKFREEILLPSLKDGDSLTIDLNGLGGVGSSFWDEAFGGLVRKKIYTKEDILKRIDFTCTDDSYLRPYVFSFIKDA